MIVAEASTSLPSCLHASATLSNLLGGPTQKSCQRGLPFTAIIPGTR